MNDFSSTDHVQLIESEFQSEFQSMWYVPFQIKKIFFEGITSIFLGLVFF